MDLTNLKPAEGALKKRKRIGRGEGSGDGDTATRGHKGAKSRSGSKTRPGYEGGQMPLYRRLPKFGFKNRNRKEYTGINLGTLQNLIEQKKTKEFNPDILFKNGIIGKNDRVKILGRGEINDSIVIAAHAFSASAKKAIEEKGGTVEIIDPYKKED